MARKYPYQKEAVSPHGAVNHTFPGSICLRQIRSIGSLATDPPPGDRPRRCDCIVGHTCATLGSSKDDLYYIGQKATFVQIRS
jgi:hypothetical protein